jgi:hypothetical protein
MRAREFLSESDGKVVTINIPITITIPSGSGDPVVAAAAPDKELPPQPVNVFPLQQQLELLKHQEGKRSKVLSQILDDNGAYSEDSEETVAEQTEFDVSESLDALNSVYHQTLEENQARF